MRLRETSAAAEHITESFPLCGKLHSQSKQQAGTAIMFEHRSKSISNSARRTFLKTLGGGMLTLLLVPAEVDAQESGARHHGAGEQIPQNIGAWLHISPDGAITVFTGKAEVGQNIRTSLTQAVADELRLEPSSIQLVMADTAQTPFDMGTFGSRTTPTMAPQLRKAAACARELLMDAGCTRMARRSEWAGGCGRPGYGWSLWQERQFRRFGAAHRPGEHHYERGSHNAGSELAGRREDADKAECASHRQWSTSVPVRHSAKRNALRRHSSPGQFRGDARIVDAGGIKQVKGATLVHDRDFIGVTASDEVAARKALQHSG